MKKMTIAVMAALAVGGLSYGASATQQPIQAAGKYYVGLGFGRYYTDQDRNMDDPFTGALSFGYRFSDVVSAQLFTSVFEASNNTTNTGYTSYFAGIDGILNLPTHTVLAPYFGLGLGMLKVTEANMAADFVLGLNYNLNTNFGLNVDLHHFAQLYNDAYNDNLVTVGVRWSFGGQESVSTTARQVVASEAPVVAKPVKSVKPAAEVKPIEKLSPAQEASIVAAEKQLKVMLPANIEQCGKNGATPEEGCITLQGSQITMHLNVRYERNKASIRPQYTSAINKLGNFLKTYPQTDATLFGFASSEGPVAFNQALSLSRAEGVKSYLVKNDKIATTRLKAVGMGTKDPVASNETEQGRQLNRRVEAAVTVTGQQG